MEKLSSVLYSDITIINLFHFAVNQEIRNPCYLVTSICTRCSVSRSAKHGIVCLDNIVRSTYVYIAELLIGVKIAYSHNEYVDIQFGAYNAFYFEITFIGYAKCQKTGKLNNVRRPEAK